MGEQMLRENSMQATSDYSVEAQKLVLSSLPHTWLIDIDGTIAVHNGYLQNGQDILLNSSAKFLRNLPKEDYIIFLTSREEKYREQTVSFLRENRIRYDRILFGLPLGERVLINDNKPSGLCMSYAVQLERNRGIQIGLVVDKDM